MTSLVPVVELIRVSSLAQALEDRAGIPAQRAANVQTCGRFGLRVIETIEVVESGATVAKSTQMARVLDLIGQGRAHGVVLAAYDRLFRPDRWEDLAILQVFMDARAQIYVPAGPIDLQTETGYVQATVGNLLAGLERRRIRERTMRARDELRRQGKLASGTPPFGLAYSKKGGWSYTPEIEQVRELFQLYLSGQERRQTALAKRLGFHYSHVRKMLEHPIYSGWLVWNLRGETVRIPLGLPPVVSEEDFSEVQRILLTRGERISLGRKGNPKLFLYRGMLFCPCGQTLYGMASRSHGKPMFFYGCASMRKRDLTKCPDARYMASHLLEPGLDRVVQEHLGSAEFIIAAVQAYNDSLAAEWRQAPASSEANTRRIDELERRRGRILDTFYDGKISRAERDKLVEPLDVQLHALRSYQFAPPPAPSELNAGDVLGILSVFAEWSYLERDDKRRILEALAPAFVVNHYTVEGVHLHLNTAPSSRRAHSLTSPAPLRRFYLAIGASAA